MAKHEVHLELLVGREVLDSQGKKAGRIEEVRAVPEGAEWVVEEYLIGPAALLERLAAWPVAGKVVQLLSIRGRSGYNVPWDKLDISDPSKPRLTCPRNALEAYSSENK